MEGLLSCEADRDSCLNSCAVNACGEKVQNTKRNKTPSTTREIVNGFADGFTVCNESDVGEIALSVSYFSATEDSTVTEGWFRIESATCANIVNEKLVSKNIFYYAKSIDGSTIWGGPDNRDSIYRCSPRRAFKF